MNVKQLVEKQSTNWIFNSVVLFVVLCTSISTCLLAQPVLVDNGVSEYTIVISTNPEPAEYFAAQELRTYLEQMSGIKLPIKSDIEAQGRNLLLIGKNSVTDRLHIALKPRFPLDDTFIIRNLGDMIILLGCSSRSTLFAVYQFLEFLGCRWYAPNLSFYNTWTGEFVPERNEIYAPELNYQFEPAFRWRRIAPDFTGANSVMDSVAIISWAVKNKINIFDIPYNREGTGFPITSPVLQSMQLRNLTISISPAQLESLIMVLVEREVHPEWLRLIGGFRSTLSRIDMDMANPELCKVLPYLIQKNLAALPPIGMFVPETLPVENDSAVAWQLVRRFFPSTLLKVATSHNSSSSSVNYFCTYNLLIDITCSENLINSSFDSDALRDVIFRMQKNVTHPIGLTFLKSPKRSLASEYSLGIPQYLDEFRRWGVTMMCWSPRLASWEARELEHYMIASAMTSAEIDFHQVIGDYGTNRFGAPGVLWWEFFMDLSDVTDQFLDSDRAISSDIYSQETVLDNYILKLNSLLEQTRDDEQKTFFLKKELTYVQYVKLRLLLLDNSTSSETKKTIIQQMQQLLDDTGTAGLIDRSVDSSSK